MVWPAMTGLGGERMESWRGPDTPNSLQSSPYLCLQASARYYYKKEIPVRSSADLCLQWEEEDSQARQCRHCSEAPRHSGPAGAHSHPSHTASCLGYTELQHRQQKVRRRWQSVCRHLISGCLRKVKAVPAVGSAGLCSSRRARARMWRMWMSFLCPPPRGSSSG